MVSTVSQSSQEEDAPVSEEGASRSTILLPDASFVAFANFEQVGFDLVITNTSGETFVVYDYFAFNPPPDLVLANGAGLTPEAVALFMPSKFGPDVMFAGEGGEGSAEVELVAVGRVSLALGDVRVIRVDGSEGKLARGDTVYRGDRIQTGDGSFVKITMKDNARFNLGKNAEAVLKDYEFNETTNKGVFEVFQSRGGSHYRSGKIGKFSASNVDSFTIKTPTAIVGIRGSASDQHEGDVFSIHLLDGIARVNNFAGTAEPVILSPGQASVVADPNGTVNFYTAPIGAIQGLAPSDTAQERAETYTDIPPTVGATVDAPLESGETDEEVVEDDAEPEEALEGEETAEEEAEEEAQEEEIDGEEEVEAEADVEAEAESEPEVEAEAETEQGAETEAEAEPEVEAETEPEAESRAESEAEAEREVEEAEAEAGTEPEGDPEPAEGDAETDAAEREAAEREAPEPAEVEAETSVDAEDTSEARVDATEEPTGDAPVEEPGDKLTFADNSVADTAVAVIDDAPAATIEPTALIVESRAVVAQGELLNGNRSPVAATPISDQVAVEGLQFGFSLSARNFTDPDGDFLNFKASGLPAGLSFDAATETILGTPTAAAIGEHIITVEARDAFNAVTSTTFKLTVLDQDAASSGNIAPILSRPIFNQEAMPGEAFSFQIPSNTFVDLNGDPILFSVSGLPDGFFFSSDTNTISGSPTGAEVGLYAVRVRALDDKGASGFDEFVINIFEPIAEDNADPVLAVPIFDQVGEEGAAFQFLIPEETFSDADGDSLDITVTGLPDGLVYDDATRNITGTPTPEAVGSHTIQVSAADGHGGLVDEEFVLDISSAQIDVGNESPTLSRPIFDQKATENEPFSLTLDDHFIDPDGDELSFSIRGLPTSIFYDEFTRTIIGTPTDLDLGSFRVQVTVFDGGGGRFVEEFFLDVIGVDAAEDNGDPFLTKPLFDLVIGENETVSFALEGTFSDPDGDPLVYEVTGLPTSLFVDPATNAVIGTPTSRDVGSYLVEVTAFDGRGGRGTNEFVLEVLAADVVDDESNTAPNLVRPLLDEVVAEGDNVFIDLASIFNDADGDVLTYRAAGLPPSFFLDDATGAIQGQPTEADFGSHVITVTASDGRGGLVADEFNLNVIRDATGEDNTAPTLIAPIFDQEILEGEALTKDISKAFEDKDGDELQFTIEGQPTSLFLDPATNTIIGTPTAQDVGSYAIRVTATDDTGAQVSDQFFLEVLSLEVADVTNTPPRLISPFLDQTVEVGSSVFADFNGRFEDPDGDILVFNVSGLPPSLFLDPATNSVIGALEEIDVGSHLIKVSVSDGRGGTNSAEFLLSVVAADAIGDNTAPTLNVPLFDAQFVAGDQVSIPLEGSFFDADGDDLEYVVTGLPTSLFTDPATNSITGTLTEADVGSFTIAVNVFDGKGGSNFDEFCPRRRRRTHGKRYPDECPGIQILKRLLPDLQTDTMKKRLEEFEYIRNGTMNVLAFLHHSDGKVYAECHADHKTETFLAIFRRHVSACPEEQQIHYVMDNLATHISYPFCQVVAELSGMDCPLQETLDKPLKRAEWLRSSDKRIVIHFTPYHGSWLNLIEIWFGIMNKKVLRESFASPQDLTRCLDAFVDDWNLLLAHPFRWTYTGDGLHEKAIIRFTKILGESADELETSTLTKQLKLMRNLLSDYFSEIPEDVIRIFIDTLQSQSGALEQLIQQEQGPVKKEKAQEALASLMFFIKGYASIGESKAA